MKKEMDVLQGSLSTFLPWPRWGIRCHKALPSPKGPQTRFFPQSLHEKLNRTQKPNMEMDDLTCSQEVGKSRALKVVTSDPQESEPGQSVSPVGHSH